MLDSKKATKGIKPEVNWDEQRDADERTTRPPPKGTWARDLYDGWWL